MIAIIVYNRRRWRSCKMRTELIQSNLGANCAGVARHILWLNVNEHSLSISTKRPWLSNVVGYKEKLSIALWRGILLISFKCWYIRNGCVYGTMIFVYRCIGIYIYCIAGTSTAQLLVSRARKLNLPMECTVLTTKLNILFGVLSNKQMCCCAKPKFRVYISESHGYIRHDNWPIPSIQVRIWQIITSRSLVRI